MGDQQGEEPAVVKSHVVFLKLPPGLYRRLCQLAAADDRNLQGMIKRLIAQASLD